MSLQQFLPFSDFHSGQPISLDKPLLESQSVNDWLKPFSELCTGYGLNQITQYQKAAVNAPMSVLMWSRPWVDHTFGPAISHLEHTATGFNVNPEDWQSIRQSLRTLAESASGRHGQAVSGEYKTILSRYGTMQQDCRRKMADEHFDSRLSTYIPGQRGTTTQCHKISNRSANDAREIKLTYLSCGRSASVAPSQGGSQRDDQSDKSGTSAQGFNRAPGRGAVGEITHTSKATGKSWKVSVTGPEGESF